MKKIIFNSFRAGKYSMQLIEVDDMINKELSKGNGIIILKNFKSKKMYFINEKKIKKFLKEV